MIGSSIRRLLEQRDSRDSQEWLGKPSKISWKCEKNMRTEDRVIWGINHSKILFTPSAALEYTIQPKQEKYVLDKHPLSQSFCLSLSPRLSQSSRINKGEWNNCFKKFSSRLDDVDDSVWSTRSDGIKRRENCGAARVHFLSEVFVQGEGPKARDSKIVKTEFPSAMFLAQSPVKLSIE